MDRRGFIRGCAVAPSLLVPERVARAAAGQQLMASGQNPFEVDPYFSSVVGLYHMDGANGSTTFTDSSGKGHHWNGTGGSVRILSTSTFKFGTASFFGNGANSCNNSINHADYAWGTADLTFEAWVKHGTTGYIWGQQPRFSSTPLMWGNFLAASTSFIIGNEWDGDTRTFSGGTSNGAGNWNFFSLSRVAGVWYGHENGVILSQSGNFPASRNITFTGADFMGEFYGFQGFGGINGNVDEIRLTKGVGRYSGSNYTPPTAAFPNS